eukprot:GHVS01068385.1.p1 GENE.GHVS01068385.1~~GHVS01068385.1.p1  ORF type:complete len:367 (-),score=70.45 GHVS01068385.1:147-1247(-)
MVSLLLGLPPLLLLSLVLSALAEDALASADSSSAVTASPPAHLGSTLFPPSSPTLKHPQLEYLLRSHVTSHSADKAYNRISHEYNKQEKKHDAVVALLEAKQRSSLTIPFLPPPKALYNEMLADAIIHNRTEALLSGAEQLSVSPQAKHAQQQHNTKPSYQQALKHAQQKHTDKPFYQQVIKHAQQHHTKKPSHHHHHHHHSPLQQSQPKKGRNAGGLYSREIEREMRTAKKRKNRKRYMFGENDRNRHFYNVDDDCYWRITTDDLTRCVQEEELTAYRQHLPSIAVAKDFTGMYSTPEEAVYGKRPQCAHVWLDRNTYTYYCIPVDSEATPIDYLYEQYYKEKMDKYRFYAYAKEAVKHIPMPYS